MSLLTLIILLGGLTSISFLLLNYGNNIIILQSAQAKSNTVVATIPVGDHPFGITYDSNNAEMYVANSFYDYISPSPQPTSRSVSVLFAHQTYRTIPVGANPIGIAYDSGHDRIYVANANSGDLSVIDAATNTVIGTPIQVKPLPWEIAYDPDNRELYITDAIRSVNVVDTSNNAVIGNIQVRSGPHGIAYDPANKEVYVANQGFGTVTVINATTNMILNDIQIGTNPEGVAYNPTNKEIYVTGWGGNFVSVINGTTNSVIKRIAVGTLPFNLAYDSVHDRMYVADSGSNDVSVIDCKTNTVIGTPTEVGDFPLGVAFNAFDKNVYVTNSRSNTVSAISTLDRGKLDVSASAQQNTTTHGNMPLRSIILSVSDDEDSQPVTGLGSLNIKVNSEKVPAGAAPVEVQSIAPGGLPGFYRIELAPIASAAWLSGEYVFSISVTNEDARGQTISNMFIR